MFDPGTILIGRVVWQGVELYSLADEITDGEGDVINDLLAMGRFAGTSALIWAPLLKPAIIGTTVHSIALPIATGVAVGAVVGSGVTRALFGEEGMKKVIDMYTNPRFEEGGLPYEIADILGNAYEITKHSHLQTGNRAVEGNAAGLPTGWNTNVPPGLQANNDWRLQNFQRSFPNA